MAYKQKTRNAYGKDDQGNWFFMGDMLEEALSCNMMLNEYCKKVVAENPTVEIEFRVEAVRR